MPDCPRSYAKLKVSTSTYNEIRKLLEAAGYADQFKVGRHSRELLDMHGLALERDESHDDDCMDCGQKPEGCKCA
jgi:hypothetical protein